MKKRCVQSLVLTLFLLVIFQVAESNKHYNYKTNSPRAGAMAFTYEYTPVATAEVNKVPVVAKPEPEVPRIETSWLWTMYTKKYGLSSDEFYRDIELLNRIVGAEAGNQSELGKRLVIDVVLNRIDSIYWRDDDTIWEVITHPGQFETYSNGAYTRVDLDESINELIVSELKDGRTNVDVIYFRTNHYFDGVPALFKEGDHYFSGEEDR